MYFMENTQSIKKSSQKKVQSFIDIFPEQFPWNPVFFRAILSVVGKDVSGCLAWAWSAD